MENKTARWVSAGFSCAFLIAGALWGCSSSPPVTPGADAGRIEPTPGTTVEVLRPITLTDRARFPEENPHLVDVEVMEDRLAFIYDAPVSTPPFAVDDVVAGIRHEGYLRRLTGIVQVSPTRIETTTVHAELGELIGDGHFRVHFEPGTATGDLAPSGETGAARAALTAGFSGISPELRTVSCSATEGGTFEVHPRFDVDFDLDFDIDIRWTTRFLIPRGEFVSAIFAFGGELETGITVKATADWNGSCSWNLVALAEARRLTVPKLKVTFTFAIGAVPVIVTYISEPYVNITVGGGAQVGPLTGSGMARLALRAGVQFDQATGWQRIWEPRLDGQSSLDVGHAGTLTVMGSAMAGVKNSIRFYDAIGPAMALGGHAGYMGSVNTNCAWSRSGAYGVDLTGSIDVTVPVMDWQLASLSVSGSFLETPFGEASGEFPWCPDAGTTLDAGTSMDAGAPDAGPADAGPPPGTDAGPGMRGARCVVDGDCASRFCADGVCCNARCAGECMSCIAATSRSPDGTCDAIREDSDPDGECPGPQTCQAYRTTAGATAYCRAHYGDACTGDHVAVDCPGAGTCVEGVCCDNLNCNLGISPCSSCLRMYTGFPDGDCQTILAPMDPYDDCSGASVCWGGTAAPACCLPPGSACVAASDCCSRTCTASTCT